MTAVAGSTGRSESGTRPIPTLPDPPTSFRGRFSSEPALLDEFAGSRGPVRLTPRAVARPRDTADVAALIEWAGEHGVPVVPRGAGTGMPAGNTGSHVILDLSALSAPLDFDDERGLVRAGAAVVAEEADALARRHGRRLPALPSSSPWCTLGGMVANDAAGARSFRFGATHAWLADVTWVRADGRVEHLTSADVPATPLAERLPPLVTPWPRVRKNSSGYALDRFGRSGRTFDLVAGSEGTLGVVTEVALETRPLPQVEGVALIGLGRLDELPLVARFADAAGASACEYLGTRLMEFGGLDDDPRLAGLTCGAGVALVEFCGSEGDVAEGLESAQALGRELGGSTSTTEPEAAAALWKLRHAASPTIARAAAEGRRSLQFIEDCVVPVDAVGHYAGAVRSILARHDTDGVIFGHLGDGNLHVNPLVDLRHPRWRERVRGILEATVSTVSDLGGTLAGEHGDGRLRAPLLERVWAPDQVAAFREVKATFDAAGILNPGVIISRDGQDPLEGFAAGFTREESTAPASAGRLEGRS